MRHLVTCSLAASLVLLLAACGGRNEPDFDTPNRDGGRDAGVDGGDDGGGWPDGGEDGGSSDAGGNPDGGDDGGIPDGSLPDGGDDGGTGTPMRAIITLTDIPQVPLSTVEAVVTDVFDPPPPAGCSNEAYDPNAPTTLPGFDAGQIVVGGLAGSAVTLNPVAVSGGVEYQPAGSVPRPLFNEGNVITANAMGGPDLGAFSINLTTPQEMALISPTPGATVAQQPASSPMTITWTPGGGDLVVITLTPADLFYLSAISGTMLVCVTNDTGSFEVPAQYLAPVRDGGAQNGNAFLGVTRSASVTNLLAGGSQAVLWAGRSEGAAIHLQ
ncbi:MAG: hypothetical protein P1V51_09605 [Deltaproteobacteria bacterium]|nr:hypothetical protein [Deltaproteobacteria bacterium]